MEFSKIIENIENELHPLYIPGAIKYIDEKYDNAWSKALHRFDVALSKSMQTKNFETAKMEGEIYKQQILQFIAAYKKHKRAKEVNNFIDSLTGGEV